LTTQQSQQVPRVRALHPKTKQVAVNVLEAVPGPPIPRAPASSFEKVYLC
jgi:hypothetical protein